MHDFLDHEAPAARGSREKPHRFPIPKSHGDGGLLTGRQLCELGIPDDEIIQKLVGPAAKAERRVLVADRRREKREILLLRTRILDGIDSPRAALLWHSL